ncbi:propanediol utilization protein [Escherichia coli]|nr:propanediol utilization protein [Escherichia coli]
MTTPAGLTTSGGTFSWLREAGAHNVLVTSAVNNNGVTELFALLHTEEGCC